MTSFAKACIDFSNNLKNLRFSKSNATNKNNSSNNNNNHNNNNNNSKDNGDKKTISLSSNNNDKNHILTNNHHDVIKKEFSEEYDNVKDLSTNHKTKLNSKKINNSDTESTNGDVIIISNRNRWKSKTLTTKGSGDMNNTTTITTNSVTTSSTNSTTSTTTTTTTTTPNNNNNNNGDDNNSNNISSPTNEFSLRHRFWGTNSTPTSPIPVHNSFRESTQSINEQPNDFKLLRMNLTSPLSPTFVHRLALLTKTNSSAKKLTSEQQQQQRNNNKNNGVGSVINNQMHPYFHSRISSVNTIKQRLLNQGLKLNLSLNRSHMTTNRYRNYLNKLNQKTPTNVSSLWFDVNIMNHIFDNLHCTDLFNCSCVCSAWYKIIIESSFYNKIVLTINLKEILNNYKIVAKARLKTAESGEDEQNLLDDFLTESVSSRMQSMFKRHIRTLKISHVIEKHANTVINAIKYSLKTMTTSDCAITDSNKNTADSTNTSSTNTTVNPPSSTDDNNDTTTTNSSSSSITKGNTVKLNPIQNISSSYYDVIQTVEQKNEINTWKNLSFKKHFSDHQLTIENAKLVIQHLILKYCIIYDQSMSKLINVFENLKTLELISCNDFSELALWICLMPSLETLTLFDCINVSDETMNAVSKLVPELKELNLQAYHITDSALCFFDVNQRNNLHTLRLQQCMDITSQGIINMTYCLTNLQVLNLSGCSKLTDDGLDMICENIKCLTSLDLSWCPKISDSGLECVACDLILLKSLNLDRCTSITHVGISHLSAMPNIQNLSLRWCSNLCDAIIPHLLSTTTLKFLCLSGCKRLSQDGLSTLARHSNLNHLELYHLPSLTYQIKKYLCKHLPDCLVLS